MIINIDIPDGERGAWKVETFTVTKEDLAFFNLRAALKGDNRSMLPGTYKKLTRGNQIIMSNTRAEIRDLVPFIRRAKQGGHILINGLGLGVALAAILESPEVLSVTVIEKSEDVIALVAKHYEKDDRVTVIHADAFLFKPPKGKRYNAVWHDIWDGICSDNLPEMAKLHRKYGRITDWQRSWGRAECRR